METRGRFSNELAPAGTLVRFITGTGGGYGEPKDRDAERVLDDVANGYVTRQDAEAVYGVALTTEPLSIDWARTKRLRGGAGTTAPAGG
jgi:N-methylhydantoinase B